MKNTIHILIFLLLSGFGYSQNSIKLKGIITDSLNRLVPYTSVYIQNTSTGTFSDTKGYFVLEVSKLPVSLVISNVGYQQKVVLVEESSFIKITLAEKVVELAEVVFTDNRKEVTQKIGSPLIANGMLSFSAVEPFEQLGLMIKNKNQLLYDKQSYLHTVSIKIVPTFIGGTKGTGVKHLRLRLYKITEDTVGQDILNENVFAKPKNSGWYKMLLPNPIKMPINGIVVAVEWLEDQQINDDVYTTYGLLIDGHRIKENQKEYYKRYRYYPLVNRWGYKKHKKGEKYFIPAFRLELKHYE